MSSPSTEALRLRFPLPGDLTLSCTRHTDRQPGRQWAFCIHNLIGGQCDIRLEPECSVEEPRYRVLHQELGAITDLKGVGFVYQELIKTLRLLLRNNQVKLSFKSTPLPA